jgi:excisionase family DNA binding protein
MDDLLTVRQLQELLRVDRITIYRMLDDGRLTGFKVGSQWRFSRRQIEDWLRQQANPPAEAAPETPLKPAWNPSVLPIGCYELVQAVFAESLDIACVATDAGGEPISEVSNGCEFCRLILETPEGRRRCAQTWKQAASRPMQTCHAGLTVAGAPAEFSENLSGCVVACQFACGAERWEPDVVALTQELGGAEEMWRAAAKSVHTLSETHCRRLPRLLGRLAGAFCEMGQERAALLGRLRRIAEMTALE